MPIRIGSRSGVAGSAASAVAFAANGIALTNSPHSMAPYRQLRALGKVPPESSITKTAVTGLPVNGPTVVKITAQQVSSTNAGTNTGAVLSIAGFRRCPAFVRVFSDSLVPQRGSAADAALAEGLIFVTTLAVDPLLLAVTTLMMVFGTCLRDTKMAAALLAYRT